mmetsp:Transcript_3440/g.4915  ORF Transcript_3440/g.4915 Transcript_3440/m.4915 type:complete len:94 (-) Transcript_3440:247-528(-)
MINTWLVVYDDDRTGVGLVGYLGFAAKGAGASVHQQHVITRQIGCIGEIATGISGFRKHKNLSSNWWLNSKVSSKELNGLRPAIYVNSSPKSC